MNVPIDMDRSHWTTACLIFVQPNYHHHGLLLRFLEAMSTTTGIAISSAIHELPIVNFLVAHYTDRLFQFPPESLVESIATEWAKVYPCAGFGDIPVSLSNRDTEASAIQHPFTGDCGISRSRFRRLDSLVDSKRYVDILHIAEPASRILDILAGSQTIISRDQPALIFEVNGLGNIAELARSLETQNYLLLDSSLLPVVADENHGIHAAVETETCFLGLSKAFLQENGLAKALWPNYMHLAKHQDWQRALIAGFSREVRNGGIRFGSHSPTRYRYPFNEQLLCKGFYPTEHQDQIDWRWLGPKPSASVWLPKPRAGSYRLELIIIGAPKEDLIDGTRLFLNGTLLALTKETNEGATALIASIEIPIEEETPQIELVIAVPSTHRANSDDPRQLGICVSYLDLVAVTAGD